MTCIHEERKNLGALTLWVTRRYLVPLCNSVIRDGIQYNLLSLSVTPQGNSVTEGQGLPWADKDRRYGPSSLSLLQQIKIVKYAKGFQI